MAHTSRLEIGLRLISSIITDVTVIVPRTTRAKWSLLFQWAKQRFNFIMSINKYYDLSSQRSIKYMCLRGNNWNWCSYPKGIHSEVRIRIKFYDFSASIELDITITWGYMRLKMTINVIANTLKDIHLDDSWNHQTIIKQSLASGETHQNVTNDMKTNA